MKTQAGASLYMYTSVCPLVFVFLQNVHKALMKGILFSIPRRKMEIGLNLRDFELREITRLSFAALSAVPNDFEKQINLMAGSCSPTIYPPVFTAAGPFWTGHR